jgi:sulfonate transport system ATP-binding protein
MAEIQEKKNYKFELNHVQKKFQIDGQEVPVLKDIDLQAGTGEFISIVGASGCGKSTLIRILAGLEHASSGEVLVDGTGVVKPSIKVGMIFQEARLLPWLSTEKNIGFGIHGKVSKEEKEARVAEMIKLIGLEGFEKAIPKQLSGGMQQRVNIARTLINKPDILLLDEPFGALDALTRINMQNEVLEIWQKQKTTMILITHDIDEAIFLSDRIIVLSQKPGVISKSIKVDMGRPRDRNSYDFTNIRRTIYNEFFENSEIELEYYL